MLKSTPHSIAVIQYLTLILSVAGLFYFNFNLQNCLLIFTGYFLYSGIGISMTMHRYLTHKSFEFSNKFIKWICIWFALMAGRGGLLGWVYTHRMHHAFSDTEKDPHFVNFNLKGMFFPSYSHLTQKINLRIIKDLLDQKYINLDKYYHLLLLIWATFLFLISPELLYFFWIVPVALTHIILNSFIYIGHISGYKNYEHRDNSVNSWIYGILFWGEGWHNNHHKNPQNWSMTVKWWEIDLIALIINLVKKDTPIH
jgi:fatty-acid desaturase